MNYIQQDMHKQQICLQNKLMQNTCSKGINNDFMLTYLFVIFLTLKKPGLKIYIIQAQPIQKLYAIVKEKFNMTKSFLHIFVVQMHLTVIYKTLIYKRKDVPFTEQAYFQLPIPLHSCIIIMAILIVNMSMLKKFMFNSQGMLQTQLVITISKIKSTRNK